MNTNQALLDLSTEFEFAAEQSEVRLMTLDELSMVGGGQDSANIG